jgi:ADP-heptose:LPS heptosyltransferase
MIKSVHKGTVFCLGDPMDMPEDYPNLVNLAGKTTWLETVYLLTKASKVFCIDSAVLHLCRGLSIPYFCLWGHTDPMRTLGVPAGPQDIGAGFGTPLSLMNNITPLQVFNRAFSGAQA